MLSTGFDEFPCHVLGNFNRFGHSSALGHKTGQIIRSRKVLARFQLPDLKARLVFPRHVALSTPQDHGGYLLGQPDSLRGHF